MKIIPKPYKIEERAGEFVFSANTALSADYPVIKEKLEALAVGFKPSDKQNGINLKITEGNGGGCGEAYRLEITPEEVLISAESYKGLYYGVQTLIQAVSEYETDGVSKIPCAVIEDAPRYPLRSYMLDVSRHFFCLDDVKRQIDLISFFKINRLHLHFCDDQGFRIEIKKYPELTVTGAYRRQTRGDGKPHGGFYTQDEIADLVSYAAARAVEIIPEFEIPGHCAAVLAAYPELSCRGERQPVGTRFGIYTDIYCAGEPKVLTFINDVLTEICALFPGEYIHLGGDEAPKIHWRSCPKCNAAMKNRGLKNYEQLQAQMINEAVKHIKKFGKTAIVWNESMESGILDDSAVCQYWWEQREDKIAAAANGGRKIIVSKTNPFYLDYPHGSNSMRSIYDFDLSLPDLDARGRAGILGFEAALWTEYVSEGDIDLKTYPRIIAAADRGWTACPPDYEDFKTRLGNILPILERAGVKYAPLKDADPGYFRARKSIRAWRKVSGGDKEANAVYRMYMADKRKNGK